jgi:PAS domain S-box-containing protein
MPKTATLDYRKIFDALPMSQMVIAADDPDFTIVAENPAHEAVALVKHGEIIGQPFLAAFPDTSAKYRDTGMSDIIESLRRVVETGEPDQMEVLRYDIPGTNGRMERRYWQATHHPLFDSHGNVAQILQISENITQRVIANRRREEAERQLNEALSIGLIGTWLWDLKDDYLVADGNLIRMFGLSAEEVIEGLPLKRFTDAIHPEDRPRIIKVINDTVKAKSTFEEEYRTVRDDGEVRWVIARGRVETDDNGAAVRFPGVIVDVSERKQTEQNLRYLAQVSKVLSSSLDYSRTLKSVAKLAVPELADWCTIDILEDDRLKLAAVAHKDPAKVAWAKRYRKVQPVHTDDPGGVAEVLRSGKAQLYPVISDEMLVATSRSDEQLELARSLKMTSAMIAPLKLRDDNIGAITFISTGLKRHYSEDDLRMAEEVANRASLAVANSRLYKTAQEEIAIRAVLEEQLREANDALMNANEFLEARVAKRTAQLQETNRNLERSNQELQDFAYVASHDLQEPLRKIQAFGNLLEDEYGKKLGDGSDYLDRMRNAASRMSVLIEDLLAFSRVTTKANPIAKVDLNVIAREVLDDLEIRLQESAGTVKVGRLPNVCADPFQMRQLLQNLISNALKFSPDGVPPRIKVYAETLPSKAGTIQSCQLCVEDNGIGFDEKYLDRIFSVFQRLHSKEAYQGTGIGLAICRKIAERHGGSITARSQPGKGSTFIVTLPGAAFEDNSDRSDRVSGKSRLKKSGNITKAPKTSSKT